MAKIFKVAPGRTAWSNHWQKHFYEGETIDLSHSTDADIATLLEIGAIVEIPGAPMAAETPAPVRKPKKESLDG